MDFWADMISGGRDGAVHRVGAVRDLEVPVQVHGDLEEEAEDGEDLQVARGAAHAVVRGCEGRRVVEDYASS